MTVRKWIFTLNLGTEMPISTDFNLWDDTKMTHLVYQLEKASTGQYHLQGACHFAKPQRMNGAKALLGGDRTHVEPAKDYIKAVEYCKKDDTRVSGPWEHGKLVTQGHRSDLSVLADMVMTGKRPREIALEMPTAFMRYAKGIDSLRKEILIPKQRNNLKVALLWGETRTGKTRAVYDLWNAEDVYRVFDTKSPWFDGYQDHRVALLDDFGDGMMNIHYLKNILDRYPMDVPIKGSRTAWNPELIIITSNGPPELWYPSARLEDLTALKRRFQSFHFPSQKQEALEWLNQNNPLSQQSLNPPRSPAAAQAPQLPVPIQIGSSSSSESDNDTTFLSVADDEEAIWQMSQAIDVPDE